MYKKDIVQPASDEEVVCGDSKLDPLRSLPAKVTPDCHLKNILLRTLRAAPESEQYLCYFIIGLQDRYGIGDSIGGAQLTMEEVWIVQTGNFTLNGLVLLLFCNFFGKVKVVLEPQDMLADLIRVLAFA